MGYEAIALLMFSSMMLLLLTGQRVFGAIGAVATVATLSLWGAGGSEIPFSSAMKLMKWYPLLTVPLFIYMGYIISESKLADDLYDAFHVWFGSLHGGLAIGTIVLMVIISAINGLSVAPAFVPYTFTRHSSGKFAPAISRNINVQPFSNVMKAAIVSSTLPSCGCAAVPSATSISK